MHVPSEDKGKFEFLVSKDYLSSTLILFLSIFSQYTFRTLISLWVKLDESKCGMGWNDPTNPGRMNMTSGVISMILPLVLTNVLKQKFGIRTTCMLLCVWIIVPNSTISYTLKLPDELEWTLLVAFNGLTIAFFTIFLSIVSIAVSNAVDSSVAGTAIGVSQSVVAGSRALSTAGTALLFGYLQRFDLEFPFDSHFLFLLNDGILCITMIAAWLLLGRSVENRIKTTKEESLLKDIDRDSN